ELLVRQPVMSMNYAAVQERHDRQAAAENKQSSLGEIHENFCQWASRQRNTGQEDSSHGGNASWHGFHHEGYYAAEQKQPDDLLRRPCSGHGEHGEDTPKQLVTAECELGQFEGRPRNDPNDCGADAIKASLHPGESTVTHVGGRERQHHAERWQYERDPDGSRSHHAGTYISQVHGKLRRQRTGSKLGE